MTTPSQCPDAPGAPGGARIVLTRFRFVPSCFTMRASQGFSLHNADEVVHNLSIPGTLIDLDTRPDMDTNTEAVAGVVRPGTYEFFCKYHRGRGMTGRLRVLP